MTTFVPAKQKFPIALELGDGGPGFDMECNLTYDADLLLKQRVDGMLQHFEMITAAAVGNSDVVIGEPCRAPYSSDSLTSVSSIS